MKYSIVFIVGVSPPPGAVLVLHSLPLEFPLAMAFAEQLLTWKLGESNERSEDELDTVPSSVLLQVVELLGTISLFIFQHFLCVIYVCKSTSVDLFNHSKTSQSDPTSTVDIHHY